MQKKLNISKRIKDRNGKSNSKNVLKKLNIFDGRVRVRVRMVFDDL